MKSPSYRNREYRSHMNEKRQGPIRKRFQEVSVLLKCLFKRDTKSSD